MLQQAFNGLVGGAFYALLALGLAVIFGMLGVVNLAHGAFYMLGAFGAFIALDSFGLNFWVSLILVPPLLGVAGIVVERLFVRRLTPLDPLYNFLFTFGLALILQDVMKRQYGVNSQPYPRPSQLGGTLNLGLFTYPAYQVFVLGVSVLVCGAVWVVLTRTRVGMIVRASTERPELTRALGIDVGRWVTPVFGFGIALAALAGVLAAPMRAVNPLMGADLIITVFAVVVIGGLGSVFGSVAAGFAVGLLSALGNYYVPSLSQTLVFILMAAVLLWRPAGLFGREEALR
ncbi:branched-chain amino acid ABC transporter permease [Actinomadura madurae]|uniref:branched-chain amino acid ABC transporter permease n=1 Tax=Actinomadura madurae TaxID=1993 RepID=UPI0020D21FCD|nr:branched-chain amino acid ABC transporter permease [Actinomadura madurae]MCP9949378.1 branched-chain amino acid ABC transporter permease [Actinomadura madurae]MCP9949792.1 branched-chain amino acid ABC transporter permease [Actinomadura madurae]MCP9966132.1 branched-chain amino acid ABC transporter permease [Actinomadura madurae]MCP9966544.1 branched-chain amino acid ABC transporter permease [Actinomadura madurae]MCP9978623.1 branched-chain amino acid ABC transporter permease [Actinomadura 